MNPHVVPWNGHVTVNRQTSLFAVNDYRYLKTTAALEVDYYITDLGEHFLYEARKKYRI